MRSFSFLNLSFSCISISSTTSLLACDIFRSLTCHMIVHCFPLMYLLAANFSYGSDTSFQNRSAACIVLYIAFLFVHISLVCHVCVPYVFSVLLDLVLWSALWLCLSVAYVRCHPCWHVIIHLVCQIPLMYVLSYASIVYDSTMASIDTLGKLVSSLFVYILWYLPSAHPLAFIVPSRFPLRNIKYLSAFLFSRCDILCLLHGICACQACCCFTSLSMASYTLLPYSLSPSLMFSCVSIMSACVFGNTIVCCSDCAIVNCTLIFGLGCRLHQSFTLLVPSSVSVDSLLLVFISDIMFMSSIVMCSSASFSS